MIKILLTKIIKGTKTTTKKTDEYYMDSFHDIIIRI